MDENEHRGLDGRVIRGTPVRDETRTRLHPAGAGGRFGSRLKGPAEVNQERTYKRVDQGDPRVPFSSGGTRFFIPCRSYEIWSSTILNILRMGSAAPQRSWSPTV